MQCSQTDNQTIRKHEKIFTDFDNDFFIAHQRHPILFGGGAGLQLEQIIFHPLKYCSSTIKQRKPESVNYNRVQRTGNLCRILSGGLFKGAAHRNI